MHQILKRGDEIHQMMTVVGEEGTPIDDFTTMLKAEFFDSAYLQQNAFDDVDAATSVDRQRFVFDKILEVIDTDFDFNNKDEARHCFKKISSLFINWNYSPWDESVIPEDQRQDEKTSGHASEGEQDSERGSFTEILKQIDEYIQSLINKTENSESDENELQETKA